MAIVPSAGSLRGSDRLVASLYSMASADFDSPPGATRTAGQTSQTLVCHRWSTRSVNRFPHLFFAALVAFLTGPARDTGVHGGPLDHLVLWVTDPLCR